MNWVDTSRKTTSWPSQPEHELAFQGIRLISLSESASPSQLKKVGLRGNVVN